MRLWVPLLLAAAVTMPWTAAARRSRRPRPPPPPRQSPEEKDVTLIAGVVGQTYEEAASADREFHYVFTITSPLPGRGEGDGE